ncbi:hypothetical protein NITHO_690004 [Nitrolancea hollandica Lb]|uniref:Uncharacterized protein n=1 Tax=Nitrolancea hollandica Lb TaxID=1129897 RepID=I4EMY7_9BACT|nr:hypothetical protein NITHO_690004 [Nitrolancea hollandica Lb]
MAPITFTPFVADEARTPLSPEFPVKNLEINTDSTDLRVKLRRLTFPSPFTSLTSIIQVLGQGCTFPRFHERALLELLVHPAST